MVPEVIFLWRKAILVRGFIINNGKQIYNANVGDTVHLPILNDSFGRPKRPPYRRTGGP